MTTIYLARHGQTEENLMKIFQGHLPGTLTADGIEQARNLGKELEGIQIDCILSSDLKRVIDTVNYAMADRHLPWEKTELLREIDWGKWTGLKIDSVDKQNPPEDAETKEMLYEPWKAYSGIYKGEILREKCIGSGTWTYQPIHPGSYIGSRYKRALQHSAHEECRSEEIHFINRKESY